jgi:hypothetical protein
MSLMCQCSFYSGDPYRDSATLKKRHCDLMNLAWSKGNILTNSTPRVIAALTLGGSDVEDVSA